MAKKLSVQVWSDIACPWCYVGKRRFEAALAQFARRDEVSLLWRSFELDPSAPRVRETQSSYAERLAKKYGTVPAQAQAMIDRMVQTAAAEGLAFDFERIRPGNTFDAHRLLHLARQRGRQGALKERLFAAYLGEGQAIGEPDTLLRLASEVGLDVDEAQGVLATDAYANEVRADEREAHALGVSGVPFFVIGRYGVPGAQPAELLLKTLEKALAELPELPDELSLDAGQVCGPDGCS
jgi:predicted DsbA family dithiol-disulfide isomerase